MMPGARLALLFWLILPNIAKFSRPAENKPPPALALYFFWLRFVREGFDFSRG